MNDIGGTIDRHFDKGLVVVVSLVILVVFGKVGEMDVRDAASREALYCEMVSGGHWKAYDNSIKCN